MECKQCGGTGLIINNKYCRCTAGKFKKEIDQNMRNETLKAIIQKNKTQTTVYNGNDLKQSKPIEHNIQVGDWVEYDGLVCMVGEISRSDIRVFSYRDVKGEAVEKYGWVSISSVTPVPLEGFEDYKAMAIDCALLTEDAKWFKQLMKKGVTS